MKIFSAVLAAKQKPYFDSQEIGYAFEEGEVNPLEGKAAEVLRLDDIDPFWVGELFSWLVVIAVLFDDGHA